MTNTTIAQLTFVLTFSLVLSKTTASSVIDNDFGDDLDNDYDEELKKINWGKLFDPIKVEDPDVGRNTTELIKSRGFVVEEHFVVTNDGYVLGLHRIVNPKRSNKKRPIILQHGLGGSSTDWLVASPGGHIDEPLVGDDGNELVGNNLGFEFAKRGHDVWLSNVRGSQYSMNHTFLNTRSKSFWNYSLDEHIKFDLPATIDYVLKSTNSTKIGYVGVSQGTTIMFGLLSLKPEYSKVVEPFVALAPVAHVGNVPSSPLQWLSSQKWLIKTLSMTGGPFVLDSIRPFVRTFCVVRVLGRMCGLMPYVLTGGSKNFNRTREPVYMSATSKTGTSTKNMIHWSQLINRKWFRAFDYGKDENMVKYNSTEPIEYQLERIDSKHVVIMSAESDSLADPTDVQILRSRLVNAKLIDDYVVPDKTFGHVDFGLGKNVGELVNKRVIKILSGYDEINSTYEIH